MRILLIDVNCKNSSTGKIVYDLYTECRKKGHEASVCYGRGDKIDEPNVFKFGIDIETYFHAFMTRITGFTGCYSFFSTKRLLKYIKKFEPDVVHIHELHAYFVNIIPVINYLKRNNIKTVWTFHCEFMYTGKCGYAYECNNWVNGCGNCTQVKAYPTSLIFDFTKKMYKQKKKLFEGFNNLTIVTPSKWLADRVKESFLGNKHIIVIHNGIDTENIFYHRSFEHLKVKHNITEEKVLLAVAPDLMSERKGGKWVLKLAEGLKEYKIKIILIGVEELNQKFSDNVIAIGKTQNQIQLSEYYSMADAFVICSNKETFSLTCVESLCCGTPVIGFKCGAPIEIAPKGYGTFINYGDLDELIELTKCVLNKKLQIKTKEECELFGKEKYNKASMVDEYLNIFNTIPNSNETKITI